MMNRDLLAQLASAVPADFPVSVPAGLVLELLAGHPAPVVPAVPPLAIDRTVAEVGALLGRRPSTIRNWCARGRFPGAYRHGGAGEWRVPLEAIESHQYLERRRAAQAKPYRRLNRWRQAPAPEARAS